jgi:hypothetical protein
LIIQVRYLIIFTFLLMSYPFYWSEFLNLLREFILKIKDFTIITHRCFALLSLIMELAEELELPPWEKFRKYGLFPYKMVLHIFIVILITILVLTTNISYASYSRAVWLSAANILFPPGIVTILNRYSLATYVFHRLCRLSDRFIISLPIFHIYSKSNN